MKDKTKLNLGCGMHLVKGFINIDNSFDIEDLRSKVGMFKDAIIEDESEFIRCEMQHLPFKENSVDYIESIESIEHVPLRDVVIVFAEMYRVLKPGCKALVVTTDFADIAQRWLDEMNQENFNITNFFELTQTIYGQQITEGEYHRSAFSPWYIKRLSDTIGFKKCEIVYFPRYSRPRNTKTIKWSKDGVLKSAFIYATMTK